MSLEIDKQRRMAIRAATPQTRKGTPKEDEDMLVAMRRRIVEDCARRLDGEISIRRSRAAQVSGEQQAIDGHVIAALEAMAGVLRREIGHHALYQQLPPAVRQAAERM
jgi:hypothetical protein